MTGLSVLAAVFVLLLERLALAVLIEILTRIERRLNEHS